MQYTLDSIAHVESALQAKNKGFKVFADPVLIVGADLTDLAEKSNRAFFGVLTIGEGVRAKLAYEANEIITMDANSQIIEVFTSVKFQDEAGAEVEPKGIFRGFEVQIR